MIAGCRNASCFVNLSRQAGGDELGACSPLFRLLLYLLICTSRRCLARKACLSASWMECCAWYWEPEKMRNSLLVDNTRPKPGLNWMGPNAARSFIISHSQRIMHYTCSTYITTTVIRAYSNFPHLFHAPYLETVITDYNGPYMMPLFALVRSPGQCLL